MIKKQNQEKELREFSKALTKFITAQKQNDPLLIGAALMKKAMEMYTHTLDNNAIYSLLNVVAESIPEIREQLVIFNESKTVH